MKNIKTLDKFLHTWISAALVVLIAWLLTVLKLGTVESPIIGLISVIIIGVLKELIWDKKMKKGTFSLSDIFADVVGSFTGFVISLIILNN